MSRLKLHPKVRNAAIVGVLLAVVSVLNALVNVYPDQAWTPIASTVLVLLTAYMTPSAPRG